MDFLNELLAKLFDSFKAKNPTLATVIIMLLGVVLYLTENGLPELIGKDLNFIVQIVTFVLAALQGSRTTTILHPELKDKK
jgi:hypothetical protein